MRFPSPLRYPGGKAGLTEFLSSVIARNDLTGCSYYEPYAGGAGAALGLLQAGAVSELFLNDADVRINAFWRSALNSSARFVERIQNVPLTIEEWYLQRDICQNPSSHNEFDVGFAAFFMNRCNRSGVITGAGPIGGMEQSGNWRLDVRFNRDGLCDRINALSRIREQIHIAGEDGVDFLKRTLPRGRGRNRVFSYLDPPYVNNGHKLYMNSFQQGNHADLADYMHRQGTLPWIMSYDDSSLVRTLYARHKISIMTIRYTLQEKRSARELIIAPHQLSVPATCRTGGIDRVLEAIPAQEGAAV
jgi:DNA adenine methylase